MQLQWLRIEVQLILLLQPFTGLGGKEYVHTEARGNGYRPGDMLIHLRDDISLSDLVGFLEECSLVAEVASGLGKEVVGLRPKTQFYETSEFLVVDAYCLVDEVTAGVFLSFRMNMPQPQGVKIPKAERTDEQSKAIHWRVLSPRP